MGRRSRKRGMVKKSYVPERGDLVWLNFNPIRGHEQGGRRPALVISAKSYNRQSGLALVCPVTSRRKGYPFETEVFVGRSASYALADQVRAVDWHGRRAEPIGAASEVALRDVQEKLRALLSDR